MRGDSVLDHVLSRLDRVRRAPHGFIARCPAHHDRTPSLSIRELDGRVTLHCFAGCLEADCWRALDLEKPGQLAPATLFHRALLIARAQARRRGDALHRAEAEVLIREMRAEEHTSELQSPTN